MTVSNYDSDNFNEFVTDEKEPSPILFCKWCGIEIYTGENYYNIEDSIGCENCISEFLMTAGEEI